ncbi:MAG: hypothetical protein ACNA8K_01915 [Cyclonatronaceae bacterium]
MLSIKNRGSKRTVLPFFPAIITLSVFLTLQPATGQPANASTDTNTNTNTNSNAIRVLTGAALFDGTGSPAVENSVIVIDGSKIVCAGSQNDCTIPDDAEGIY